MKDRLAKLRARLEEQRAEALLATHLPDIRWACGFTGSNGLLVVRRGTVHLVTDGRYRAQAAQEVRGAEVHVPGYDLIPYLAEAELLKGARRVLVQAESVTLAQQDKLRAHCPDVLWQHVSELFAPLRGAKDETEIAHIQAAQRITDDVFEGLLGFLRPGRTEREVAAEIVYRHLRNGAERMAFEPVVASGPNGALPHARPTDREIEPGEMVVIDMGGVYAGYASDMTRTVAVGEPGERGRAVYEVVREAQAAALDAARASLTGTALDRVARDVIEEAGYGKHFSHSLGHGIGLETHEWPRLSRHVEHLLPEETVVTIEPGIYLPGKFGIRIEDLAVLHTTGCENLTTSPRGLIVL